MFYCISLLSTFWVVILSYFRTFTLPLSAVISFSGNSSKCGNDLERFTFNFHRLRPIKLFTLIPSFCTLQENIRGEVRLIILFKHSSFEWSPTYNWSLKLNGSLYRTEGITVYLEWFLMSTGFAKNYFKRFNYAHTCLWASLRYES